VYLFGSENTKISNYKGKKTKDKQSTTRRVKGKGNKIMTG
jgi:hypothetical protein